MTTEVNSLYRKHRPKKFSDIVGQTHVVKILKNQIESGKINHAYLFVGTRGTGKTTAARIFANTLGGELYEIDAASNNSVDNVRELVEKTKFPPINGKYKVYIIDEVHMFSTSAFNAFLKTLEEPPAHVIFILATTEAHKLPQTILSRVLRLDFLPLSEQELAKHLEKIFKAEGIKAEPEAISAIAKYARGSARDAMSIAESVMAYTRDIKRKDVQAVLGFVGAEKLTALLASIQSQNIDQTAQQLNEIFQSSVNVNALTSQFMEVIKTAFITSKDANLMKIYRIFAEIELLVKTAYNPRALFEGACYSAI